MHVSDQLFRLRCRGRGICDFTGRPHENLSGTMQGGGFFTIAKAAYPPRLASSLANEIFRACAMREISRQWNLLK
eukprot:1460992-Pyramimonas_sp.AAC.1